MTKIGNIELGERPVFLAPMEDVTDIGFRLLCKRFGASMVYTEFVSAEALVRDIKSTVQKLTIADEERPVGIQIYGRDIDAMVDAAKIVEQAGPDLPLRRPDRLPPGWFLELRHHRCPVRRRPLPGEPGPA